MSPRCGGENRRAPRGDQKPGNPSHVGDVSVTGGRKRPKCIFCTIWFRQTSLSGESHRPSKYRAACGGHASSWSPSPLQGLDRTKPQVPLVFPSSHALRRRLQFPNICHTSLATRPNTPQQKKRNKKKKERAQTRKQPTSAFPSGQRAL